MGSGLLVAMQTGQIHPGVLPICSMLSAYRTHQSDLFNESLKRYEGWLSATVMPALRYARYEAAFNRLQPFYRGAVCYVFAALLWCLSWLLWPEVLRRSAYLVTACGAAVHLGGVVARMFLQGRPPVTNLYSSAVFVGLIAVILGLVLEAVYRRGAGVLVAVVCGSLSLVVAHHLASSGDTLEMMQAVLDSNFWLATHVVTITIGYGATFLAGFLAHIYIICGLLTRTFDERSVKALVQMVYGVVCFSLLLSFVGTVLGGIWADQSWGRFWGWDPKENGALLIVLWNAAILHMRWAGAIRRRGLMAMAVFGNIVTAWSWFGVNMLGVGLHSYGFMDKIFIWLAAFAMTQVAVIVAAGIPARYWRSPSAVC
ncbi:MAG: cytochrome c biogenesis protein CcsA [Elusimicrobiota bacterium]